MESNVELDTECWAECRLSISTFAKIRSQKFRLIANSNVELNVNCLARHWMLSLMSIAQLDIECWAECRLSSSTFAKIRLQMFGRIANPNVELNVDCLARHSMLSRMSIVELDIECWAECRLSSSTFAKIRLQKFGHIASSNVELNFDCLARHSMLNRMSS